MFSVLRSAACGSHGILHSIFLTCVRLVDGAVNMLFSSEIFYFILFIYLFIFFFWTPSSSISFSCSLFTITDVYKVSWNISTPLLTVTKLIPSISYSIFPQRCRLIFETSSWLRSSKLSTALLARLENSMMIGSSYNPRSTCLIASKASCIKLVLFLFSLWEFLKLTVYFL